MRRVFSVLSFANDISRVSNAINSGAAYNQYTVLYMHTPCVRIN